MSDQSTNQWYQRAVFYELHARAFKDSSGDGNGDLRGVIERLDHLQDLGVDCIWLLPIYQSPLRDGGYDISDFFAIHPDYGALADFEALVEAAHARDMRVIADMVVNHTSDQHPWFVESRSSRDNPKRGWYVWSDTDQLYSGARVIFLDSEDSNWTLDPTTGQYYWHRFYSHQPDLNYDNPNVRQAMLDVMDFWLEKGIDGFRVDAVPYLIEREGTDCENLPETHEVLKGMRRFVDEHWPEALLLCEANQPPAQVKDYFGRGEDFLGEVIDPGSVGARGAAFLAGLGSGVYGSPADISTLITVRKTYEPQEKQRRAYDEHYGVYVELRERVRGLEL